MTHNHLEHHHLEVSTEKNILIALILNLTFSILELIGGFLTNSVAIMSDSVHSFGDALFTGIAYVFEHLSRKHSKDGKNYGYTKYSLIGGAITTIILFISSSLLIVEAIERIENPAEVSYEGMIVFAILGASLNFLATLATRKGDSINQKSVNIHMLEDTLSWIAVLIGAIVMKLTGFTLLDPILSIGIAIYIFINAFITARTILLTAMKGEKPNSKN